ncbi:MAG: tetratricopeptide repeat protein [Thermoguttaceae bacterium]|nr:tetratricopeptide repeat protein [Thermoguttaceae bacterium]MDW8039146.1 tetratricopeptide repeat protein [Thermoguttaceae bacterium]
MGCGATTRDRPGLRIAWLVGMVGLFATPTMVHGQTSSRFPHAADPNYQKTYESYRSEMASRSIVAPALGYEGSSEKGLGPTASSTNSAGQGGLSGAFSSLGQSIKQGWNKLGELLTPKERVEKAPEPTSVFNPARPSADTYVALARFCAENGRLPEAEQHYLNALRTNPRHLGALLGYAKLLESLGRPTEAMQVYQRALSLYPQEPSVFNNAGLCYARSGQLQTAASLLHRAVQLDPKKSLYRNNLAMVLVDMGRPEAALAQLRAVHPEPVARYNLGQLLFYKGDLEAAAEQFAAALQADPSMQPAQAWLEELARRKAAAASDRKPEVAHRPQPTTVRQPPGRWSEISDQPLAGETSQPPRVQPWQNRSPSQPQPIYHPPAEPPQARLDYPRIYAQPGGNFSAQPPTDTSPSAQEELAPLPPVDIPAR